MKFTGPKYTGKITIDTNTAGTTQRLVLPRDRFIQEVYLRLRLFGDSEAASDPHAIGDNLARFVKQLKVTANGKDSRIAVPLIDLHRINKLDSKLALSNTMLADATLTNAQIGVCEAHIHFGLNQNPATNKRDISALLPAHVFSSLEIEVEFETLLNIEAAASDYTIDSGELAVSLREVDMTDEEVKKVGRFLRYHLTSFSKTVGETNEVYPGHTMDFPVGKVVRRSMLTRIDNGLRVDGAAYPATKLGTWRYRIHDSNKDRDLMDVTWEESQMQDKIEYGIAPDTGVTMIDFGAQGGMDLRGYAKGQAAFQSLNVAVTGTANTRLTTEEFD